MLPIIMVEGRAELISFVLHMSILSVQRKRKWRFFHYHRPTRRQYGLDVALPSALSETSQEDRGDLTGSSKTETTFLLVNSRSLLKMSNQCTSTLTYLWMYIPYVFYQSLFMPISTANPNSQAHPSNAIANANSKPYPTAPLRA